MKTEVETMSINGVQYVRADSIQPKPIPGKRAVIVVDRGWIVAGDVTEADGRIKLSRAVHVFRWETIGFAGVVAQGKAAGDKLDLRPLPAGFDMPKDAEIFRIWVADDWGL